MPPLHRLRPLLRTHARPALARPLIRPRRAPLSPHRAFASSCPTANAPAADAGPKASGGVLSTFSLAGRVAAVTGGARGLGLAMARALREAGARVALVDLDGAVPPPLSTSVARLARKAANPG
jgi:NADPH-dependent 2,4-dienoyl-CoA reductase/sulfur reductase-like enzyme